jgi:glycosyltransferase involved in cell wall biosynthesis
MKYATSLRPWVSRRLEKIGTADLLIGIPSYNNQDTIEHVIKSVSNGLHKHYPEMRSVIIISDGGSTDDTRDVAHGMTIYPFIEKIVQIYRGHSGKGSALRSIFEAANFLEVKACAVVDSDLRSINPDWVRCLLQPVIGGEFQFVAPLYTRYKYDGTITNNIVYPLTRALFGKQIRQPIGGDFGFSHRLARYYAMEGEWDSDIARFGIDIWMTISAITQKVPICQAYLGTKVHDVKDPGDSLGPMVRQVLFTLFSMMDRSYDQWSRVSSSEPVPTMCHTPGSESEKFTVDVSRMIHIFREGFEHFGAFWKSVLRPATFAELQKAYEAEDGDFLLPSELWAKIVYEFSATFHGWERHRRQLVDTMSPLYYARAAAFVKQTSQMDDVQAERVVEEQANCFEALKQYLMESWHARAMVVS